VVATFAGRLRVTTLAFALVAAVRMLFDWLITGQIVPMNPAAAVRGPKHVVKTGKTPVLEGDKWRKLLASLPTATLRDLRDAAGIAEDRKGWLFRHRAPAQSRYAVRARHERAAYTRRGRAD
jgi:site-specific recombinase XerC